MSNEFIPIKNSHLSSGKGVRFNPETGELDIHFNEKDKHFYRYQGFQPADWEKIRPTFDTEDSTGTMLRQMIKDLKYERKEL